MVLLAARRRQVGRPQYAACLAAVGPLVPLHARAVLRLRSLLRAVPRPLPLLRSLLLGVLLPIIVPLLPTLLLLMLPPIILMLLPGAVRLLLVALLPGALPPLVLRVGGLGHSRLLARRRRRRLRLLPGRLAVSAPAQDAAGNTLGGCLGQRRRPVWQAWDAVPHLIQPWHRVPAACSRVQCKDMLV